eukprot:1812-Chlamydomonas_euryale.AAC.1
MHSEHAQRACTASTHSEHAQGACTGSMHREHAQGEGGSQDRSTRLSTAGPLCEAPAELPVLKC